MGTQAEKGLGLEHGRSKYRAVRRLRSVHEHERTLALFGIEEREVVVETIGVRGDANARTALAARAKAYASVVSPHLTRVVEASSDAGAVTFVTSAVAGEWLDDLRAADARQKTHFLALAVELRVLLDVLAALSAIHSYKGAGAPLVHGAVAPSNVLVGVDGTTRLVGAIQSPAAPPARCIAHLAPEILLGDGTADARADVYSACALLWEALAGKPLFTETTTEKILARQLAGPLPRPIAREAWAEPLAEVAARGLAVDPAQRHASVSDIAMAIRLVAQARLAAPTRVGRTVESLAEDKLARRKAQRAAVPAAPPSTPRPNARSAPSITETPAPALTKKAEPVPRPAPTPTNSAHESGMRRIDVPAGMDIPTPRVAFPIPFPELAPEDLEPVPPSGASMVTPPPMAVSLPAVPLPSAEPPPPEPAAAPLPPPEPSRSEVNLVHVELPSDPDVAAFAAATPRQSRTKRIASIVLLLLLASGVWIGILAWLRNARPPLPAPAAHGPIATPTSTSAPVEPGAGSVAHATSAAIPTQTPAPVEAAQPAHGTQPEAPSTPAAPPRKKRNKPSMYEPEGI